MRDLRTTIAMVVMALGISFGATAQEKGHKIGVEVDPATFVFNGYGVHLRWQPKNTEHVLLGIGTYAMNMPDALVNFNANNKDKGWDVRLNQGYGLFTEYHFTEVNRKLFVGAQTGIQEFRIDKEGSKSEKFSNTLAMGYIGYTFKPFDEHFYIKPWAGIGYVSKISGENVVENVKYDIDPITMFMTLHVGYTF